MGTPPPINSRPLPRPHVPRGQLASLTRGSTVVPKDAGPRAPLRLRRHLAVRGEPAIKIPAPPCLLPPSFLPRSLLACSTTLRRSDLTSPVSAGSGERGPPAIQPAEHPPYADAVARAAIRSHPSLRRRSHPQPSSSDLRASDSPLRSGARPTAAEPQGRHRRRRRRGAGSPRRTTQVERGSLPAGARALRIRYIKV